MGTAADTAAFENIRALHTVASKRGDNALSVLASLLEGLALLRTAKNENVEKIRDCIAQIAKFQFDQTTKIIQLEILTMLLDVASTLHRENPDVTAQKLRSLQKTLDECDGWHNVKADFLIPIKKRSSTSKTVSNDTMAIVRPGSDDEFDYIVVSFMTKMEMMTLV